MAQSQTSYTYDPFGNPSSTGTSSSNTQQYTGRETDGTGLQYNRARYYSPTLQRFISEDPSGFGGGDPNLYAYVGNDPINATDPSGVCPLCAVVAGACLIGAAGGAYYGWTTAGRKDQWQSAARDGWDWSRRHGGGPLWGAAANKFRCIPEDAMSLRQ